MILAATEISNVAATSAVAGAAARICLICVHGFTFVVKKFVIRCQQHLHLLLSIFQKGN